MSNRSDNKIAKLEGELDKLKKKKAVLQAHINSAKEIRPTEEVCKTIIEFISAHSEKDFLLTSNNGNIYTQHKKDGCCSAM